MSDYTISAVTLITGAAGSGKTYHSIELLNRYIKENPYSSAFVVGLNGYTGKAQCLDIEPKDFDWQELPDNSICVVDEAHKRYPNHANTATPQDIIAMREVRHRGINLLLISQSPMSLSHEVRRICACHRHVYMISNKVSKCLVFPEFNPEATAGSEIKRTHIVKLRQDVYSQYKSSSYHNTKRPTLALLQNVGYPFLKRIMPIVPMIMIFAVIVTMFSGNISELTAGTDPISEPQNEPLTPLNEDTPTLAPTTLQEATQQPYQIQQPINEPVTEPKFELPPEVKSYGCITFGTKCQCIPDTAIKNCVFPEPTNKVYLPAEIINLL